MRIFPIDESPGVPDVDSSRPETGTSEPETAPAKRKPHRLIFLITFAGGIALLLAFLGYRYYHVRAVRNAIEPLMQNITLRTANDLNYSIDPQKITYKELFDKLDKDKAEIDSKIIDLQTIETKFSGDEIAASLTYARACEALLRALEAKYYKDMEMSSAVEWNQKTRDLYSSSNYFGRYYAKRSYDEAVANFEKKSAEYDSSVDDLAKAIKDAETSRTSLSNYLADKFLLDTQVFAKLTSSNKKIKDTK